MPNATQIAVHLHRTALAAAGFTRTGQIIRRLDGGLRRTLTVHTRTLGGRQVLQLPASVAVAGLPAPVTATRHDALHGTTGVDDSWYPLTDPLPAALHADVSGPLLDFLLAADDLDGFALWAQDVHAGDLHPGWWRRFRPVMPLGTGPLQAAAFAAAAKGDGRLVELLAARVENEERDEHTFAGFLTELQQLHPTARRRNPRGRRPARD